MYIAANTASTMTATSTLCTSDIVILFDLTYTFFILILYLLLAHINMLTFIAVSTPNINAPVGLVPTIAIAIPTTPENIPENRFDLFFIVSP